MFRKAIVRPPGRSLVQGLTEAGLGLPDYDSALRQHAAYVRALEQCGLDVMVLPADEAFPDSTFVEDTALLTPCCAVITNPGAPSRGGEVVAIREAVGCFYDDVERIEPPGTLDAGDVMMVGTHFYIGRSARTNDEGAAQLVAILERHGMSGSVVTLENVLHLKTGVNYLDRRDLLVSGEFVAKAEFRDFDRMEVGDDESYAANSLWINGKVLTPAGFPRTKAKIEAAGYETIVVDVSEFRKLDGGLSCLSLRF
jgi:dimethylargininase